MVPPMLLPFLKEQLGVDYLELGFALTVFAVISPDAGTNGLSCRPYRARKVLLMGLTLGGFALIILGLHLSYSWLIASAVLLGSPTASIIRPIMRSFRPTWMTRAWPRIFDPHLCRLLRRCGGARIVAALVATIGGYGALIVAGAVGPAVALLLVVVGIPDASAADRKVDGVRAPQQSIITPAIIVLTIFFMLLSLSNAGIGNFAWSR